MHYKLVDERINGFCDYLKLIISTLNAKFQITVLLVCLFVQLLIVYIYGSNFNYSDFLVYTFAFPGIPLTVIFGHWIAFNTHRKQQVSIQPDAIVLDGYPIRYDYILKVEIYGPFLMNVVLVKDRHLKFTSLDNRNQFILFEIQKYKSDLIVSYNKLGKSI